MAKSLRSKREKRLRTLRREIAEPFYDKKDLAKFKAQESALNAPKLPVRTPSSDAMVTIATSSTMDVEMTDGETSHGVKSLLKPSGGIGKKWKKNSKSKKNKGRGKGGKGKIRKKNI
ncbi:hypothetical protein QJS10_CPA09g00844 [Acorus calamus]|uniref:Uncharacterized protein n=1 Tax=Acorus calamus TaxID=4465 RepID=A0AAV9E6Q6_ACOCL|nr:hypothetical protein QJS10_CPA09g00844 [Acorus calamus]